MSSVNIDLAADTILNVMVGQQDENEVREVVFDFSDWYTTYGSGTISLAIQRPKDEWPYEGTLTVDNSTHKATWEISDTDSAYAGVGQIQLSYTVGTAVKKSVVYRFTVHKSLGALGSVITPIQIQTFIDEVTEALEDMQEELNDVKQDLADLEEEIEGGGAGMSQEFKTALHNILEKVAYIDEDGQDYLDALDSAMWPPKPATGISLNQSSLSFGTLGATQQLTATLTPSDTTDTVTWSSSDTSIATVSSSGVVTSVAYGSATITATAHTGLTATCSVTIAQATLTSISAVYTQSGTVYDTDSLDSLKTDLVVTAHWSDNTTSTVASTDYTLSGTLTAGTSTITVSYGGKTTTFTVTVTSLNTTISMTFGLSRTIIDTSTGNATSNASWNATDFYDISGAAKIKFTNTYGAVIAFRGAFYKSDQSYISGIGPVTTNSDTTTTLANIPSSAKYIRLSYNKNIFTNNTAEFVLSAT